MSKSMCLTNLSSVATKNRKRLGMILISLNPLISDFEGFGASAQWAGQAMLILTLKRDVFLRTKIDLSQNYLWLMYASNRLDWTYFDKLEGCTNNSDTSALKSQWNNF